MADFAPADLSPLVVLGVTLLVAAVGGIFPFSPIEPVLLGVAALSRPSLLLPAVVLATVGQMASKVLLFAGGAKAHVALSPRTRGWVDRVSHQLRGRRGLQVATVLVSACAGVPPFYVVTVMCGVMGLRLRDYLIAGTVGRAIRFSAIVTLPRLLFVIVAFVACAVPLPAQRHKHGAVSVAGQGPDTYVLLSGMVGGVAGFRRLEAELLAQGHRVVIIDPYHLSVDSADVSFLAMSRRVERVLADNGVMHANLVGHAHGAGVMLRLAAAAPHRASQLIFLDVGALASNQTTVLSVALRLVPVIARVPGGRALIRDRFLHGLRENTGHDGWLDAATQRAYGQPMLDNIDRVIALAIRLDGAREPEQVEDVVARIRIPATVILGEVPHASGPDSAEIAALGSLGARLRIHRLAGVGHFPHEEAPHQVAAIIGAAPVRPVGRMIAAQRPAVP